jgi:hypothetical protein
VSFSSDDPTVVLPSPYTFTLADNEVHNYSFGTYWNVSHSFAPLVLFPVPGRRIIHVKFTAGGGRPALSFDFDVFIITPPTISTLSPAALLGMSVILACIGVCALTRRSSGRTDARRQLGA